MSEPAMCNRLRKSMGIDLHKAIVLAASLQLIYIFTWSYLRETPFQSMVFCDASSIIINGLAALCLLWAAAVSRCYSQKLYYSWMLLFASQFSFFCGDILFAYYDLILEQSTSPSYADIFYLLSYPLFLSGILLLPAADFKYSERSKLLLDTGIVLVSSILIYWSFFIAPTIEQNIGADPQVMMLSIAYPIGDLMQLFALVELLFRRSRKSGGYPLLFLGLFCAGNIFADAVYMRESLAGTYVSGGFIDAFWIFSYLMIGLAGIAQVDDLRGGGDKARLNLGQRYGEIMWPLYLPYICASLAFVMLIYAYENPLSVPFSILSISVGLIIAMVMARQVLVLRENAALYKEAQEEISGRKAMQAQITKLNSELERRVADRTSELEKANADLQSQVLERKAAEEALKNSERRLSDIIDFLPDATFVINQSGVVIAWNRAIEKMTGIKASQILGLGDYEYALPFYGTRRPILADITLNPAPGLEKRYDNFRWQEDGTATGDVFIPNLNGKPAHIQGVAAVLYDSEGGVYGAIESLRDITERKNAEEDLKKARDRAESATEAKSKFLANMSHEIRTPMNAVIGMSDLLLQMDPTAEQRDYLDVIKNSGNALLAIINNILDYSKIDGDKLELDMRPFDLRRCIEVSMDLVAAEAGEKDIELTYFVDDSVPEMIISDEVRLKQILINLLGNAVKFTERGDVSLTVGSSPVPGGKIRLCFSVKDTGIGISDEDMGRLFQSFSQAASSKSRYPGGTGLGLAISRRLVQMMQGDISAKSTPGKGSRFNFDILCDAASERSSPPFEDSALEGKSALIVEGNVSLQKMIQKALKSLKMDAASANSRGEAEEALALARYDIAIIDAILPDGDGLELSKNIRALPQTPKIVILSRIAGQIKPDTASDPGADNWLYKPFKPGQLKLMITKLLLSQRSRHDRRHEEIAPMPRMQRTGDISILLAEDNPVNQKVALSMLKRLNFRADVAASGNDVLSMLEHKDYDVILMDIQMPDMDGVEATRHIREMKIKKQPRIIAMTAYALDGDKERFLRAGMNDYLSKPIRMDELKSALEKCRSVL